jgi:hypothetical protein
MALSLHHKSVYLIIFNATMISRSVGKTLKDSGKLKAFKVAVFRQIEKLTGKMEDASLTEDDIMTAIGKLNKGFGISFGQAQKPINVILKYHFYLTKCDDQRIKKVLHCPVDSVILKGLGKTGLSLSKIDKKDYIQVQQEIQQRSNTRIAFDDQWDKKHLKDEGILCKDGGC